MEEKNRRRTREEIEEELSALQELLPMLQRFDFFNEDRHEEHEVQMNVLEFNLSEDNIYWRYQDTKFLMIALDTLDWIEGEYRYGSPTDRWRGMLLPQARVKEQS